MNIKELLTPGVISIGVTIVGLLIKPIGDAIINYLTAKKEDVEQSKFIQEHQKQIQIASEVWKIVDEHFRISQILENTMTLKARMFNNLLLEKIPGLTQDQVDYLRQTVAGEVNKGKQALQEDVVKQLQSQLDSKNQELQESKNTVVALTQKLNNIQVAAQ